MPNYRFYDPQDYKVGQPHSLSPEAAHHAAIALRLKIGQTITLFDGQGQEAMAQITDLKRRNVTVTIESLHAISRESPLAIHLAQGFSKSDKMELVVQKAVELGVAHFTPLLTQHAPIKLDEKRLEKKAHQWEKIIQSASEQCGRNTLMRLHPFTHFNDYVNSVAGQPALFLDPRSEANFNTVSSPKGKIHLLIGPEGGFSIEEQEHAIQAGCIGISLGQRILRTETATLAACTLVQAQWGDLL